MKTKIGVLKTIATNGAKGVKFEDEPERWYNPTEEAKEQVKPEYKGCKVEIRLQEEGDVFTNMTLLEPQENTSRDEMEEKQSNDETIEQSKKTIINTIKGSYEELEQTKLETAQKGPYKLTYASWAEAWGSLKRKRPDANFTVHENENGMPVFYDQGIPDAGAFVKVSVTVKGLTHTVHLPVMDNKNNSIKVSEINTFQINKNIQRALTKAISLHGLGLYVFKGEDYPEEESTNKNGR